MKNYSINTTEAQVISAIKDTLNIAAAAMSLDIPKTTLSSILSKMEKKLQKQIFVRKQGSGEVTITEFGHEIIPKLEKILWITESIRPKARIERNKHNTGKISIISTQTILEGFLAPYLREFVEKNPEVKLTLHQKDGDFFYQPQATDIFIGCWEYNTENYLYFPFHRFKQKLWAAQSYLDATGPINSIDDITRRRIILGQRLVSQEHYSGNDFIVRRLGIPLSAPNIIYVRSGPRILDVLAEKGIGLIASSEETTRLNHLNLVNVLPDIEGEEVAFFVKADKKFLENPLAKFVTDWIFQCRDQALKSIGLQPQTQYNAFYPKEKLAQAG